MICVFSFCTHDREMALALAQHIECMGGVEKHDCIALYPDSVDAQKILGHLYKAFLAVQIVTYRETLTGWPDGPNQAFQEACQAIAARSDNEPWLWMEADCVPTSPRWLDIIEREYQWNGMQILGRFEQTFDGQGKVVGKHVSGVAVYPHDLLKTTPLIRTLTKATSAYRNGGGLPPAFDVHISHYTVKNCGESLSIQNYWKSRNFRETARGVECDFQIPYGVSNVIEMDAALIHGAKDFSLLDIIQKRLTEPIPEIMTENAA